MGCGGSKSKDDVVDTADVKITKDPAEEQRKKADAEAAEVAKLQAQKDAQAKAETAAAVAMQSAARGKRDREKVELMKHACDDYRVNMQAETFGECICGWAKAAHTAEALAKKVDKEKTLRRVNSQDLRDKMARKDKCPCERYVVNMESANFGECVCGQPKADHTEAALQAGEMTKATRVDSTEVRDRMIQRVKVDCPMFVADMSGNAEFGMCTCGAPRADHSEAALAASAKAKMTTRVPSDELRDKMTQKVTADCELYEVLMGDNSVAFGTCVCGRPRAEHSEAALHAGANKIAQAKKRDSAEVRKGFTKTAAWEDREVVDCPRFQLNLDANAAFGTCICGAPKAKHSDAALAR